MSKALEGSSARSGMIVTLAARLADFYSRNRKQECVNVMLNRQMLARLHGWGRNQPAAPPMLRHPRA